MRVVFDVVLDVHDVHDVDVHDVHDGGDEEIITGIGSLGLSDKPDLNSAQKGELYPKNMCS